MNSLFLLASCLPLGQAELEPVGIANVDGLPQGAVARFGGLAFRGRSESRMWYRAAAFSHDGRWLAVGSYGEVEVLNADTGHRHRTLTPRYGNVSKLEFEKDGSLWVVGNMITRWNADTGQLISETAFCEPSKANFQSQVVSPDRTFVLTRTHSGRLQRWKTETQELVREVVALESLHAISPDGKLAAFVVQKPNLIRIRDALTLKQVAELSGHTGGVQTIDFSSDGKTLLSGDRHGGVRHWDVASWKELTSFRLPGQENILAMQLSPDGKTLAVGDWNRAITLIDAKTGEVRQTIGGPLDYIRTIAFSPDGRRLTAFGLEPAVSIWDVRTGKLLHKPVGHIGLIAGMASSPDGQVIATYGWDGRLCLWDSATSQLQHECVISVDSTLKANVEIHFLDSNTLALSFARRRLMVWDLIARKAIATAAYESPSADLGIEYTGNIRCAALSSAGLIGVVTKKGVDILKTPTLEKIAHLEAEGMFDAAFTPDGRKLVTTGNGITMWNVPARTVEYHISADVASHTNWPRFTPDGKMFFTRSGLRMFLEIRDTKTGVLLNRISTNLIYADISFTTDSDMLVLLGRPNANILQARILELATGKELHHWTRTFDPNSRVRYVPELHSVLTTERNGTVLAWHMQPRVRDAGRVQSQADIERSIANLESDHGPTAYQAILSLCQAGDRAVDQLSRKLQPVRVQRLTPQQIRSSIEDLSSESAEARRRASSALRQTLDAARPLLEAELDKPLAAPVRKRIELLLASYCPRPSPEQLAILRGIQVLKRIGSPAAITVLRRLPTASKTRR